MKKLYLTAALALLVTTQANAASYTCGKTMCRMFGIAKCGSLALALEWAKTFPRVAQPAPSVVVVQRRKGRALGGGPGGHVSRIVSVTGPCRAIVQDNRGRYERDICRNRVALVSPRGMWTE